MEKRKKLQKQYIDKCKKFADDIFKQFEERKTNLNVVNGNYLLDKPKFEDDVYYIIPYGSKFFKNKKTCPVFIQRSKYSINLSFSKSLDEVVNLVLRNSNDSGECTICFENIIGKEVLLACQSCSKFVCKKCLVDIFKKFNNICPSCQKPIYIKKK